MTPFIQGNALQNMLREKEEPWIQMRTEKKNKIKQPTWLKGKSKQTQETQENNVSLQIK